MEEAHIHFSNGKPFKEVDKATYLGEEITKDAGRRSELANRISIVAATCNKLKSFWYKTKCSRCTMR